jgi:hypothetical protein
MKHRSKEEEIVAIDELDHDTIASQRLLQLHGHCDTGETSANKKDPLLRNIFHRTFLPQTSLVNGREYP